MRSRVALGLGGAIQGGAGGGGGGAGGGSPSTWLTSRAAWLDAAGRMRTWTSPRISADFSGFLQISSAMSPVEALFAGLEREERWLAF
jgi:hypothetical protein